MYIHFYLFYYLLFWFIGILLLFKLLLYGCYGYYYNSTYSISFSSLSGYSSFFFIKESQIQNINTFITMGKIIITKNNLKSYENDNKFIRKEANISIIINKEYIINAVTTLASPVIITQINN